MYRIDAADSVGSLPTPSAPSTENYFTDAGAGAVVDADWMNLVQESILAVLDDQSIAHSKTDYTGLRQAINAIVAAKFAAANVGAPGAESGLVFSPVPATKKFNITAGECRDVTNVQTMRDASGFSGLEITTNWSAAGPGVKPSSMSTTTSGFEFFRIFAIGKTSSTVLSIGIDDVDNAAALLTDAAGDGFTLYRQIGWVCYGSGFGRVALIYQDPVNRNFWNVDPGDMTNLSGQFAQTGSSPDRDVSVSVMGVPPFCLHVGAYNHSPGINASDNFWNIGGDSGQASASATNHTHFYRGFATQPTKNHGFQMVPTYEVTNGKGTGYARHFQNCAGTAGLGFRTLGFFWSRELL